MSECRLLTLLYKVLFISRVILLPSSKSQCQLPLGALFQNRFSVREYLSSVLITQSFPLECSNLCSNCSFFRMPFQTFLHRFFFIFLEIRLFIDHFQLWSKILLHFRLRLLLQTVFLFSRRYFFILMRVSEFYRILTRFKIYLHFNFLVVDFSEDSLWADRILFHFEINLPFS